MPQHALPRMLSPRNQSLVTWSGEWESDIDTTGQSRMIGDLSLLVPEIRMWEFHVITGSLLSSQCSVWG